MYMLNRNKGLYSKENIRHLEPSGVLDGGAENLLLFGCDFFCVKKASEINFWNDMVSRLSRQFKTIVVLSINNREATYELLPGNVHLYNVPPCYPKPSGGVSDAEYTGSRFHRLPMAPIYKTYTLWRNLPVIDRLINQHGIGVVHYMRIFGLGNSLLIRRYPHITFTITVPTHIDRGFPLHLFYHSIKNLALRPMDKIIATSCATSDRLRSLGLEDRKLEVIPWSSDTDIVPIDRTEIDHVFQELNIPKGARLILWSGPLQDTGIDEFRYSMEVARQVTMSSKHYYFVFAFKPDRLIEIAGRTIKESENVRILETNRSQFSSLTAIATAFLSPVCNPNRTVAPPITWIEMMRQGVPVVTTQVPGVEELIEHKRDGFIFASPDEAARILLSLEDEAWAEVGEQARQKVQEKYNIDKIAQEYLRIWQLAIKEKQVYR